MPYLICTELLPARGRVLDKEESDIQRKLIFKDGIRQTRILIPLCEVCGSQLVGNRRQHSTCSPECTSRKWERIKKIDLARVGERPVMFWNAVREDCLKRDNYTCRANGCGSKDNLAVHHIKPISEGGNNSLENLITLCEEHHKEEHTKDGKRKRSHKSLLQFASVEQGQFIEGD